MAGGGSDAVVHDPLHEPRWVIFNGCYGGFGFSDEFVELATKTLARPIDDDLAI